MNVCSNKDGRDIHTLLAKHPDRHHHRRGEGGGMALSLLQWRNCRAVLTWVVWVGTQPRGRSRCTVVSLVHLSCNSHVCYTQPPGLLHTTTRSVTHNHQACHTQPPGLLHTTTRPVTHNHQACYTQPPGLLYTTTRLDSFLLNKILLKIVSGSPKHHVI